MCSFFLRFKLLHHFNAILERTPKTATGLARFLPFLDFIRNQLMETIIVQETDSDLLDLISHALIEGGFNVYPLLSYDEFY